MQYTLSECYMQATIITIGDEILIGQIVDTNSAYIAKALNSIGISVHQIYSIQDNKEHIISTLEAVDGRIDLVIITGGLGPTKDDITKHTICTYFNDELVQNDEVLEHIELLFSTYATTPISDLNRKQALVPSRAIVLKNSHGTAPGMWIQSNTTVFVLLPGVPYEMKSLMHEQVLPKLQQEFQRPYILHKTILTYGLGESAIANRIAFWEDALPTAIKLAYLPNLGKVRLRLTAKGTDRNYLEKEVAKQVQKLYLLIGDIIYGIEENGGLETILKNWFIEKGKTLAVAESCTGGKIAEQLTAIPGASAYFKGGVISYATQAKIDVLHVPEQLIETYTVVSAQVAEAMAGNVQKILNTDFAIATTGNAGPTKGESDAAVGTVYIAIATPNHIFSQGFHFGNHREKVIMRAVNKAFELLQKEILKI